MAAVSLLDVSKTFPGLGTPALRGISGSIESGIITGIAGPDGAGKTTLMRLMAGLLRPDSGTLTVLGREPVAAPELRLRVGYMPQQFGLYEDLSVMENLTLHADLRDVTGEEREKTFARLLAFTDLQRFTKRLAGRLSGGMKQKLGLACALLGTPELLLLDYLHVSRLKVYVMGLSGGIDSSFLVPLWLALFLYRHPSINIVCCVLLM